jgi:cytochrome c-type biogenesis protein CcmH
MVNRYFCFLLLMLISLSTSAVIQVYKFDDPKKELQFNTLVQELRCPKCQNNNLADSNSELSVDLKEIIYEKVIEGETDQQITEYLKVRYGDFISYRPPVNPSTWFIWFGPFIFLAIGALAIIRFLSTRNKPEVDQSTIKTSQDSKALMDMWSDEVAQESLSQGEKTNNVKFDKGGKT